MLPKLFKPKNLYKLIRLGRPNDGGYLVELNSILNTKTLISFGISSDWSFEEDFKKKITAHYLLTIILLIIIFGLKDHKKNF